MADNLSPEKINPTSRKVDALGFSKIRDMMGKVDRARRRGVHITNFSIGRPDFDTPPHIKEAAKKALDDGKVHYTGSAGILELREAVCRRLMQDFQVTCDPEEIVISTGATEAIYIALQAILNPGDEVIVPQPMYVYYNGWASLADAAFVNVPLLDSDNFLLKSEAVEKTITPRTKALILNSPHNPTGQVFEREDILKLAELAVRHDFLVIADDIYSHMLYDDAAHFNIARAPGMRERTIIIGSFSKSYAMDGWRIGYLAAPRRYIPNALKLHQHIVSCPNTFVQYGALAALTSSQDCRIEMVARFDRRRRLMMSLLDDIDLPYVRPRGAFYIFPSVKKYGLSSLEFCDLLLNKARVAVIPGTAFGPPGEGHVRFAYSTTREEIEKGMRRVKDTLQGL